MNIQINSNAQHHEMTPYHVYKGTSDFASVLNDMMEGKLPVGTGKPFPVNFQSEEEDAVVNPMSPWTMMCTNNISEPKPYEIIGPRSFGL